MEVLVFPSTSQKKIHDTISVGGYCYRLSRLDVKGFAREYRCCDEKCHARVLFNSLEDVKVVGDHGYCSFDHTVELRARQRRRLAFDVLSKNITDPPRRIIEKMEVTMTLKPEEKKSLKTFISRKQTGILGEQRTRGSDVSIPHHLKVVLHESPETQDNAFLLFDSNDDPTESRPRMLIFSSADMRFKASFASEIFADGTYKMAPAGFATLYTIHTIFDSVAYPIFFCLLRRARGNVYSDLLLY